MGDMKGKLLEVLNEALMGGSASNIERSTDGVKNAGGIERSTYGVKTTGSIERSTVDRESAGGTERSAFLEKKQSEGVTR
ncbi:MAG: hypothetical protein LUI87_15665 [Lachnospiraceae bacterium]|nr:hypothetical protein [Lachnospiraceae bacterium]